MSLTFLFKIESVQVIGADRYRPDEIAAVSGIGIGDNLLRLDTGAIEQKILGQFPYIETVAVKRRFPPRVELVVTRSVPSWAAFSEDEVALITKEGKLLEKGDLLVPPEIPVVRGFELEGVTPGAFIGGEEDPENAERLRMLSYLSEAARKTGFPAITNVDLTDPLNMTIVYEARLLLVLGSESDLEYKLTFIQEVIGDLGEEDQARIDASAAARDKQVLVKWGRLENGVFTPREGSEDGVVPEDTQVPRQESPDGEDIKM
jgi:cell division protein FtsQ